MGNGNNLNRAEPLVDITTADAESLLTDLIAYAKATHPDLWTDFNPGQMARVIADLVTYSFDLATFHHNALLGEVYSPVALLRQSLIDIGLGLDYRVPSAAPSSVVMRLTLDPGGSYPAVVALTRYVTSTGTDPVQFHPVNATTIASYPGAGFVDISFVEGKLISAEAVGTSSGAANQRFALAQTPVIDGTLVVQVGGVEWTKADHAVDMAASDEEYLVETDEDDITYIIFGDGVNGKIPTGAAAITADYKVGGGKRGNLASGTITAIGSMPAVVLSVTNPNPATGGADKPSTNAIRAAIPASLQAKESHINAAEVEAAASLVSGVGKARAAAGDPLTRTIRLYIAPAGGGQPTDVLKNDVLVALQTNKILWQRIAVSGPTYKTLKLDLLAFLARGTRQSTAEDAIKEVLGNSDGTGAFDFAQVNFGGLNASGEPEASMENLYEVAFDLASRGIMRIQTRGLSVAPGYREVSASGDGTVTGFVLPTNDHVRREWLIRFLTPTTYEVYERIVGVVTRVLDTAIVDDTKSFFDLVARGFTTLNPDRRLTTTVTVGSNTPTQINTSTGGSVYLLSTPGAEYYIERGPLANTGTVGVLYDVEDSASPAQVVLQFTVNAGASPWVAGDEILVDTYGPLEDVILRSDEILTFDPDVDLTLQLSGGVV